MLIHYQNTIFLLNTEVRRCAELPFFTGFLFCESGSSPPLAIAFKSAEMSMDAAFPLFFCLCFGDAFGLRLMWSVRL